MWLHGQRSGRAALVLSFAPAGQSLDATLVAGTAVDADLHFYPGPAPLRALVGARHGPAGVPGEVPGSTLQEALGQWADALAADPWTRSWPVVLEVTPVLDGQGWWLVDATGSLPVPDPGPAGWTLLAVPGGRPVRVLAEVLPGGVRPLGVHDPAAGWVSL